MRKALLLIIAVTFLMTASGCGVKTYVIEKDRVDQEIAGNRGVLMGDVPPAPRLDSPRKRTVIGVDVEIPSITGRKKQAPVTIRRSTTPDKELWGNKGDFSSGGDTSSQTYPYKGEYTKKEVVVEEPTLPAPIRARIEKRFIKYKVQRGDTLSSIAARSEIYGDAGKWKLIYEANRDALKSPSHIYPGQTLKIPVGGEEKTTRGSRIK